MIFKDKDKEAIKLNQYTTTAKISIVGTDIVFTDDNCLVDFDYEDYRYVPNNGFIGQFVERILDGSLSQLPSNVILEDAEINVQLGIKNALTKETTFYDYGNFLITNVSEQDTNGLMKFESADYTKKFNLKYNDAMTYPCIALQLANNICEQVGVELYTNDICYPYIETDYLAKGTYAMSINGEIYEFSITTDLYKGDTIIFLESKEGIYQKTIDSNYNITRIFIPATKVSSSTNPILNSTKTPFIDFINYDFVIEGNQYEEDNSFRDVMKDISKLAYTWVRVGTDNKVHFDFSVKKESDVDTYNILTTDEYYESSKQDLKFGPVNKVLIGMSQVEGENRYKISSTYTEDTECVVKILDNNLTYTDELRLIALNGAESLFNLEYTPLNINSIGHPWLEADDYIKLINVDGDELYSYPFDRKISYCGYIKGTITSSAQTSNQSKYENPNTMVDRINKTELVVDKQNQTISAAVTKVEEMEKMVQVNNSIEGYPIEIYDAGNYEIENETIYGKCSQETSSEYNLITKQGYSTPITDTDFYSETGPLFTPLTDGWGRQSSDGTQSSRYSNSYIKASALHLKPDTQYTLFVEIRNYSTTTSTAYLATGGGINHVFTTNQAYAANGIYKRLVTTVSDLTGKVLRFFLEAGSTTNVANIEYRMMILEGDHTNEDLVYKEFTPNSPSPDYPSEIKTLQGIRNLLNIQDLVKGRLDNGIIGYENDTTNLVLNEDNIEMTTIDTYRGCVTNGYISVKPNENYVYSSNGDTNSIKVAFYDNSKNFVSDVSPTDNKFTIPNNVSYMRIAIRFDTAKTGFINEPMIEEGPIAHDYIPYGSWLKQKVTGNNLFNGILFQGGINLAGDGVPNSSLKNRIRTDIINVEPNTRYTVQSNDLLNFVGVGGYDSSDNYVQMINKGGWNSLPFTFTTNENVKNIRLSFRKSDNSNITPDGVFNIQLEKGIKTEYKPYKEQEVLIDMNKPNLFDKTNMNELKAWINNNNGLLTANQSTNSIIVNVEKNTDYTISKIAGNKFRIGFYNSIPIGGETLVNFKSNDTGNKINANSGDNTYLIVYYYDDNSENYTKQEILDSIKIYEGYSPYYELCSIGDIKDNLDVVDGVLTKRIGKVVLDGSENWNKSSGYSTDDYPMFFLNNSAYKYGMLTISNYFAYGTVSQLKDISYKKSILGSAGNSINIKINSQIIGNNTLESFKTWLSNNPVIVYYELKKGEEIKISVNGNKTLFSGYNLITLNDEPSNIYLEYLTDSSFNEQYASKSELIVQSDRITQVTDSTTSISNNLNSLTGRVGDIEGQTAEISVINNKVTDLQTSTQSLLKFETDVKENGVTKVHTETNYVFDKDGLVINESNENVSSRLNNKGLAIFDGEIKDNLDDAILYAGYDSKYSSSVLKTQKMIINDKLRFENYTTEDGKEAVGCFWVGD